VDIYKNRNKFKVIIGVVALLIGSVSLWYTNNLVKKLAEREQKLIDLSAKAYRQIANVDDISSLQSMDQGFLFNEIIEANNSIPVILTDEAGNYMSHRNFTIPENLSREERHQFIEREIARMKDEYPPIEVDLPGLKQYIYYKNSYLISQLKYYPYVQLSVIAIFVFMGYLAFSISRNAEQNRVWVGLAKETAHQLGTPLSSLMAWVEYFKSDERFEGEEFIEELEKDIQRLNIITSRFSSIGSEPVLKPENITDLIVETVDYLSRRISTKVQFSINQINVDDELVADINRPLFGWVIENICKNAVDAMGGKGKIWIDLERSGTNDIIIDISDNGKGILKSHFKKVFEPGFTTKQRGWGLGLTLVKRIIEIYHKGKIFVKHSEPGVATTFRLILKAHQKQ
jgi:signal transduction histidine kinase